MTDGLLVCSMCGHAFDPAAHPACGACPLQRGCQLVCCPACGYENVDTRRSVLARLVSRWWSQERDGSAGQGRGRFEAGR